MIMDHGCNSEGEERRSAAPPAGTSSTDAKQHDEMHSRNPRHLQWEMRFGQLQRFKSKYGHAQVPIGWPENVQLANWVSKQRQEYKNLLRGRATRLDENRIRLLNSVGFAWQLQRGGRRRQLKARDLKKHCDGDSAASEKGSTGGSDNDGDEEPCILPGEVVIGHGAPTSPVDVSQIKTGIRDSHAASTKGNRPVAKEAMPSPQHQPLQQSLQQHQTMLSSSPSAMGMQYLNRTTAPSQAPLGVPNNDLLDYVLAQAANPSSLQMLRGSGTYPRLGMQSASTPAHSHLLTTASTQRNSLLPVLAPQPSSLFPLTATAFGVNTAGGSTGGSNNSWSASSAPWSPSITSSILDAAPVGGARMGGGIGPTEDESKLSDDANSRNYKNQLQQQLQQHQYQVNQNLALGGPSNVFCRFDNHSTGSPLREDQQPQSFPPN